MTTTTPTGDDRSNNRLPLGARDSGVVSESDVDRSVIDGINEVQQISRLSVRPNTQWRTRADARNCRSALLVLRPANSLASLLRSGHSERVIPVAIVAGAVLGYFLRWWAIPIVAIAWAGVIALGVSADGWLAALGLGAANAAVGVLLAVLLRRLLDSHPGSNKPSPHRS